MHKYILKRKDIEDMEGQYKQHFLNDNACRTNKALGDLTGLTGIGFHLIEIAPGHESTEFHAHHYEDECVYIISGSAEVTIGDDSFPVGEGDFIGYPAGGQAHTMKNTANSVLKCIVVGQRLDHDISDYPRKGKRLYRNTGRPWDMTDIDSLEHP